MLIKKNNYPRNLLLDTLHGSVITSSCHDISHFSDVKYDKYVSRLSYVRKKQNKLPQKGKVSLPGRLPRAVARNRDKSKACKSRRHIQSSIINTH